jgi:hypothetical protein
MDQEDREMTNAALLLEEKINERIFEALRSDSNTFEELVIDAVTRRAQYDLRYQDAVTNIIKNRIKT